MAGLVPAIHVLDSGSKDVDARHKAGHDGAGQRASMTARYFAWILPPIRHGGRGDEALVRADVPAIHVLDAGSKDVDARHKAGHDGAGQRASITARLPGSCRLSVMAARGDAQGPVSRECTRLGIGELSSALSVTALTVMAGL